MTEFQINNHILNQECESLAKDIIDEFRDQLADDETLEDYRDEMMDRAHETADGHEWVIYNYKALKMCADCSTDYGDDFLSDVGFEWTGDSTIYSVATMIAYGEMLARIQLVLSETLDETEQEAA